MSLTEKAAVVRNLFDALGRGDFDAAVECYDPEVEFDFSRSRGPNRGIYRGRHELRKFWEEELGLWSEWLPEPQNFVETDVDTLTYSVRGRMTGRDGITLEAQGANIARFRSGRITRVVFFQSTADIEAELERVRPE